MNIDDVVNRKLDDAACAEMAAAKGDEMTDELKPCPFCGKIPDKCRVSIPFDVMHSAAKIAQCQCGAWLNISRWNARPIEDALNARIAELEIQLAEHDAIIIAAENVIEYTTIEDIPMDEFERWIELHTQWRQQKEMR